MNRILRVGIVGYGFAGATWHAPLVAATPGLELVAISTRHPEKVLADWPKVDVLANPESLLARPDIELVVLPTPNDTHYPLALAALNAGKHVVVDKPFTVHAWQAQHLIETANARGLTLTVFHNRRWDADFLTLKELLSAGQLGHWVHFESHFDRYRPVVQARWREGDAPGAGLWYDLGSHLLDQTLCLFGPPDSIYLSTALVRDGAQADDWFHAVLHYPQARAVLHASALVAALGPRFMVHGTQGSWTKWGLDPQEESLRAKMPIGGPNWGHDPQPGTLTLQNPDQGLVQQATPGHPGNYPAFYAALAKAIQNGTPPPVPADQALAVMQWIEAGLESQRSGKVVSLRGTTLE